MEVVIFASSRPEPKAWKEKAPLTLEKYRNKSLLPMKDGRLILDYQLDMLIKNNLTDVTIIVGYQENKIIEHMFKNYLEGIDFAFVRDYGWIHGVYSIARTIWELKKLFSYLQYPIVTLTHDYIFEQSLLEKVLKCKSDICCANNYQNLVKWSKKAFEELLNVLDEDEKYRFNKDGIGYPVWTRLKWNENLTYSNFFGRTHNINTNEKYRKYLGRDLYIKTKERIMNERKD